MIVGSLGAGHRALERRQRAIAQIVALVGEGRKEIRADEEPPAFTAEGIVGGVLAMLYSRLLDSDAGSLLGLRGPLMSMIVLPYLGPAAARKELTRPVVSRTPCETPKAGSDPLRELGMRLTYRTVRVLLAVAAQPGDSNRQVADGSGISDQGQISKLLGRLHGLGLIENTVAGSVRGTPNSWVLTDRGREVQGVLARTSF